MITEDYVSFETAKLLKEKGFDEATFYDYNERGTRWFEEVLVNHNSQGGVACPTLQMTMKWLREVHNKHCDIGVWKDGWFYDIFDTKILTGDIYQEFKCYNSGEGFNSYEEAAEAAIKYCLENLI
jgi:hypothetical protein